MTTHKTGTREQWLKARLALLKAEKELTRRSDQLLGKRQEPGCSWPRQQQPGFNEARSPVQIGHELAWVHACS